MYASETYALSAHPSSSFTSVLAIDVSDLIDANLLHCVRGTSKNYGACGIRIGVVISHDEKLLSSIASQGLFSFPSATADCILVHMLADTHYVNSYLVENTICLGKAHPVVVDSLNAKNIPLEPDGGARFLL